MRAKDLNFTGCITVSKFVIVHQPIKPQHVTHRITHFFFALTENSIGIFLQLQIGEDDCDT